MKNLLTKMKNFLKRMKKAFKKSIEYRECEETSEGLCATHFNAMCQLMPYAPAAWCTAAGKCGKTPKKGKMPKKK